VLYKHIHVIIVKQLLKQNIMRFTNHFFTVLVLLVVVVTSYAQISIFPYQKGFEADFGDWQQ